MIKLIVKKFVKNYENTSDVNVRKSYSVCSGILGIFCNMLLFIIKLVIGIFMQSIAVISDAFNNMSDMASSVMTIIGSKVSAMHPDKKHPFGHGRMEYITALIISFMILFVGLEVFKASIIKIINPEKIIFNKISIIILALSLFIKIWMFSYNRYLGKKINSKVIIAASKDSLNDVINTSSIIIAVIADKYLPFSIDGYIGLIVATVILKSGFLIGKDMVDSLLGTPPDSETVNKIKNYILKEDIIKGVHDLIIHDYGPSITMATAHVEVPENCNLVTIHEIIDSIETKVLNDFNINLVIHVDPIITDDAETLDIKNTVLNILNETDKNLTIHDFRVAKSNDIISIFFDLCIPVNYSDEKKFYLIGEINKKIKEKNKKFSTVIKIDNIY